MVNLLSKNWNEYLAMEEEKKCQNCGQVLEEGLLYYCSTKCQYEKYLKSQ